MQKQILRLAQGSKTVTHGIFTDGAGEGIEDCETYGAKTYIDPADAAGALV